MSTPALPKELTITLSDEEQKSLFTLLDQAVRAGGLNVAGDGLYFVRKLQAASGLAPVPAAPTSASPRP